MSSVIMETNQLKKRVFFFFSPGGLKNKTNRVYHIDGCFRCLKKRQNRHGCCIFFVVFLSCVLSEVSPLFFLRARLPILQVFVASVFVFQNVFFGLVMSHPTWLYLKLIVKICLNR